MTLSTRHLLGLSLLAFACAITPPALGADITWDGSVGNWDDDARWGGTEPADPYNAVIASGEVTVNLPGEEANDIHLGIGASAQLIVNSGGVLSSDYGYLGTDPGGIGTATISGAGSAWYMQNRAYLGFDGPGTGTLEVLDGASVSAYEAYIGSNPGATGSVRVSGVGSTWATTRFIYLGYDGNGSLTIENGAAVTAQRAHIAYSGIPSIEALRSSGVLTVTGAGSTLNTLYSLNAGYKGDADINIEDGGLITTFDCNIGISYGSDASAHITGAGSALVCGVALKLGQFASGVLTTGSGGSVYIGSGADANPTPGALIVSGTTGTSSPHIDVRAGSTLNHAGFASIGHYTGEFGNATVRDAGTTWTNAGNLYLGDAGTGTLFISQGAAVQVGGDLIIQTQGGDATLRPALFSTADPFIDVAGDAWLGGDLVVLFSAVTYNPGDAFTLIDIAGTQHGSFDNKVQGQSAGLKDNIGMVLDYNGGDGNDVVVTAHLAGDTNNDGTVNFADFVELSNNYNGPSSSQIWSEGDFNGDGNVGFEDFVTLSNNYGSTAAPAPAAVPEPTSLALLGLGGLLLTRRRRA